MSSPSELQAKRLVAEVASLEHQLRETRTELGAMKDELNKKDCELSEAQAINQQLQIRLRQFRGSGTQTGRFSSKDPLHANLPHMGPEEAANLCLKVGNPVVHIDPELENVPGYNATSTSRWVGEPNLQEIPKSNEDGK